MSVCLLLLMKRKSSAYKTPKNTPAIHVDSNLPKSYYRITRHPMAVTTVKKKT